MTKRVRQERLSKWDDGEDNPLNDDQDDYISERSSVTSVEGHFRQPNGNTNTNTNTNQKQNQNQNQQEYQDPYYTGEGPHTLRYFYNELPEDGVPAAVQAKETKKEEKQRLKEELEARRGQGNLVQGPDTKEPGMNDNYYPYWYYYKMKNPDWIMRQQQYNDAPDMPAIDPTKRIDPIDPTEFAHEPKLTAAARKARNYQYLGRDTPDIRYNRELKRYEVIGKDGSKSGVPTQGDDDKQRSTSKQYIPLKDGDDDPRNYQNGRYSRSDSRGKLNTEYDWAEHYTQYMRNKSSLGNSNGYKPVIRGKNRRRNGDVDPFDDIYGKDNPQNGNQTNSNLPNGKRNNRQHRSTSQSQQQYYNNSSGPRSQQFHNNSTGRYSQQQHSHHNTQTNSNQNRSAPHFDQNGRRHQHHNNNASQPHNLSSKDFTGTQFKVTDAASKNSRGLPQLYQTQNSSNYPPPSIYNQSSYLPPITRDSFDRPHPINYYGTQALTTDWKTLSHAPNMYKTNAQTRFYDRYLNNVIDKRLFT